MFCNSPRSYFLSGFLLEFITDVTLSAGRDRLFVALITLQFYYLNTQDTPHMLNDPYSRCFQVMFTGNLLQNQC